MGHTHSSAYLAAQPKFGSIPAASGVVPVKTVLNTEKNFNASYKSVSPLQRSQANMDWNAADSNGAFDASYVANRPLASQEGSKENDDLYQVTSGNNTVLCDLQTINVTPEFAALRNGVHTRYTPQDWLTSNQSGFHASDRVRAGAELMRLDATRLCREVCDKTKKNQDESTKRLGDRMEEVEHWKKELQNELDNMIEENRAMEKMFGCVEKALAETEEPLNIAQRCLFEREKRSGIDLVHDNVEEELLKVSKRTFYILSINLKVIE